MKHSRINTIRFKVIAYFISVSLFSFLLLGFIYVESYNQTLKHDLQVTLDLLSDEIVDHRYYRMDIDTIKEILHVDDYYLKNNAISNISNMVIHIDYRPYIYKGLDDVVMSSREIEGGRYHLTMLSDTQKITLKTAKLALTLLGVFGLVLFVSAAIFFLYLSRLFSPMECLVNFCRNFTNDRSLLPTCSGSGEIAQLKDAILELLDTNGRLIEQERDVFKEAAHELKTPLAVLKARLSLFESGEYTQGEFVVEAHKDIDKITQQLKEMLFIKSVERVLLGNRESTDIHHEIEKLIKQFGPLMEKKSLQIFFGNKFTFKIDINKMALEKIIKAIIENMISYAEIGSVIYININSANKSISFINKIGDESKREMFSSQIGLKIISRMSEKLNLSFETKEEEDKYVTTLIFNQ